MVFIQLHTLEVVGKYLSGSKNVISDLEYRLMQLGVSAPKVKKTSLFTLSSEEELTTKLPEIAALVHDSFIETTVIDGTIDFMDWDYVIRVDNKPGVTDNPARVLHRSLPEGITLDAYSSNIYYIKADLSGIDTAQLERVYSNPQIHAVTILAKNEFLQQDGFQKNIHPVILDNRPNYFWLNFSAMEDAELIKTGKLGTLNFDLIRENMSSKEIDSLRGGTLSLAKDFMDAIKKYSFSLKNTSKGRPAGMLTDTELEVLAQMWSEHCRHTLLNASIPESSEGIFSYYIKKPTLEVLKNEAGKKRAYIGDAWRPSALAIDAGEERLYSSTHLMIEVMDQGPVFMRGYPLNIDQNFISKLFDMSDKKVRAFVGSTAQNALKYLGDHVIAGATFQDLFEGKWGSYKNAPETTLCYKFKNEWYLVPNGIKIEDHVANNPGTIFRRDEEFIELQNNNFYDTLLKYH